MPTPRHPMCAGRQRNSGQAGVPGSGQNRLTHRQEARRAAILAAATRLASRGGYEAVQMRGVAESSEVALGTLYRYFPSKIHLLVAVMHDQLRLLREQLTRHPPTDGDPGRRVCDALMLAFHGLQREPRLAEAMMRALTFADRSVTTEVEQVHGLIAEIVSQAMGVDLPLTQREYAAARVVAHTWYSTVLTWLAGRASLEQTRGDIETACRLLVEDPDRPPRRATPETT